MDVIHGSIVSAVHRGHAVLLAPVGLAGHLLVIGQIGRILIVDDAVLVEGEHAADVIAQPVLQAVGPLEFHLETVLLHLALVDLLVVHADQVRDDGIDQHVGTVLVKQVNLGGQAVLEPAQLDADVAFVRHFPLGDLVGRRILIDVAFALGIRTVIEPARIGGIAADITVGIAEFQLRPPGQGFLPPFLIGNDVANRGGREETEAFRRRELLRSGIAHVCLEEVFVLVVIGNAAHQTHAPVRETVVGFVFPLVEQGHRRDMVVVPGPVIIDRAFPIQAVRMAGHVTLGCRIRRIFHDAGTRDAGYPGIDKAGIQIVPVEVEGRRSLADRLGDTGHVGAEGELSAHGQALQDHVEALLEQQVRIKVRRRHLIVSRDIQFVVRMTVIASPFGLSRRDHTLAGGIGIIPVGDPFQDPGGIIGREGDGRGTEQGRNGGRSGRRPNADASAHTVRDGRVLRDVEVQVRPVIQALEVVFRLVEALRLEDGAVLLVAQRDEITRTVRSAGNIEVGVRGMGDIPEQELVPVDIRITQRIEVRCRRLEFGQVMVRDQLGPALRVLVGDIEAGNRRIGVHMLRQERGELESMGNGRIQLRFPFLAAPRRHENDTVRPFRTEDGGCRSILQDGDGGNLVGIQGPERTFHAVDHHQGRRSVPAGYTADIDGGIVVAGLAGRLQGHHAGKFTGDCLCDIGQSGIDNGLGLDLGDGAHDGFLPLDTVSDDDGFFQHRDRELHCDFEIRTRFERDILVSGRGCQQHGSFRHPQREAAVDVRRRSLGRLIRQIDCGADDRQPVLPYDDAGSHDVRSLGI